MLATLKVRLDDGFLVELTQPAAEEVYELLWTLVPQRGAVTAAGKLRHALRRARPDPVALDAYESNAFTQAHDRHLNAY
jgi:hypothetical protein